MSGMAGKRASAALVMLFGTAVLSGGIALVLAEINSVQSDANTLSPILGGLATVSVLAPLLIGGAVIVTALTVTRVFHE